MDNSINWEKDNLPFDPWLRVHIKILECRIWLEKCEFVKTPEARAPKKCQKNRPLDIDSLV